MTDQPLVYVLDDDPSIVEALAILLRSDGYAVRTFCAPDRFLSFPKPNVPSCLILDLNLGEVTGLDVLEKLPRGRFPVVFLTGHGDIPTAVKAVRNGAIEFLAKPVDGEVLLPAVAKAVEEAQSRWSEQVLDRIERERYSKLTPRERQIMRFIVTGFLNKQTAYELGISEITVRIHRVQIMKKMGANSLADLIRSSVRLGIPGEIDQETMR